jgi:hypothetical protein
VGRSSSAPAEHAVGLLAARGDHHDRDIGAGPQLAGHLDAVTAGQHEIEDDAVVLAAQRLGLALEAIPGDGDHDPVGLEVARGELGEARVILDEEYLDRRLRRLAHGTK